MGEPDHIFVNPLPNLCRGDYPAAFPFFYIKPSDHEKIIRKFYPEEKGPVTNVDPIGNSPVIIKKVGILAEAYEVLIAVPLSIFAASSCDNNPCQFNCL